jgi:hypothetical protein
MSTFMGRFLSVLALLWTGTSHAAPILWSANNNYYEVVEFESTLLSWQESATEADSLSWLGLGGHLAVITSQEENDFIQSIMPVGAYAYWTGGIQSDTSGPVDEGWEWITGEPWLYTNWGAGEPNDDLGRQQDRMVFVAHLEGVWDDGGSEANGSTLGYIVEYEGVPAPAIIPLLGIALVALGFSQKRNLNVMNYS